MQVHLYGGKLEDGQTVSVDHSVQKFEVVIRTMNGISSQGPNRLRSLRDRQGTANLANQGFSTI
jgi:hypothetical protein